MSTVKLRLVYGLDGDQVKTKLRPSSSCR